MKQIKYILLAFLMFLGANIVKAQHIDYKTDSGFDIGFGIGGSYQQSDVRNSVGSGFDFTFGHSIYQREESFFSLDGRFRFLAGQNRAFDDRMNIDSTYNNVEYSHFNFDLELALTLNRLRNRTGIILSGFIGAGMAYNQTAFDYYDNFGTGTNNNLYDYSVIDPFEMNSRRQIYQDLKFLSDGEFETKGIDQICFTPTFGLYFGYQFSKRFSMGILHKTNLFLGEDNDIIGANIDGNIPVNSPLDLNHYTSLLFKWDIRRRYIDPVERPCNDPVVYFSVNAVDLTYASHEINGTIANVYNRADITVTVDGKEVYEFNFLPSTNKISAGFKLSPGNHTILISAKNECGQDAEIQRVVVDDPCAPPTVNIRVNPVNLTNASHELRGTIANVRDKADIKMTIDGRDFTGFSFISSTKTINSRFKFTSGTHTITVTATNECGRDFKTERVTIDVPCNSPVVNIRVNEVSLSYATHELSGTVTNVDYKSDINIKIDGRPVTGFQFNPSTKRISANFNLSAGTHTIIVGGTNDCGQNFENISVTVGAPCKQPVVNFNVNEVSLSYATHELIGTVTNTFRKSDISIKIDGRTFSNFQFIPSTKRISSAFNLTPGRHTIIITANNECGQDTETITVTVDAPCDLPEVHFNVNEVSLSYATHELSGTVTNVNYKSDINIKIDGRPITDFRFNTNTKRINTSFKLSPGTHSIIINANNECGHDFETVTIVVDAPCVPPMVNFSVNEINHSSASHELSGTIINTKNKSDITVKLDGRPFSGFQFVPSTKRISAKFKLRPGTHTIVVTAVNECGQDTETKSVVVNVPCSPPVVNFNVKEINQTNASHELTGTVTNTKNKSDITVKIDGRPFNGFQYVPSTKRISAKFKLSPGTHTIVVRAVNECGQDTETKRVVVNTPCNPPVVNFNVKEINQTNASHELTGTVTNTKNKSDITVKIDGRVFNGFQYVPSTKRISAKFKLSPGTHTVIVTAVNECGQDTETKRVVVNAPCNPPVVNFNVKEINQTNASHELTGTVTNTKNKSDITVKIDGRVFNGFQYMPSTKRISAKFKLTPGTHTIIVTAVNECGQDTETKHVVMSAPCSPPVVNFNVSEVNSSSFSHELIGTVRNVKNKSDITVKLDGRVFSAFSFVPSTKRISANFNLTPGTHTIIVTATNECGQDSETKRVAVNVPCSPPVVNFNVSEVNSSSFSHELIGTVTNIKSKSDITVKLDGRVISSFSFVPSTKKISANFNLAPGTHTIIVTATNECGQDSESKRITVEEEDCGTRINPGNSDWEFCLITPRGTYNRTNLSNSSFSYSGSASSLFFKAIAGGSNATVNGMPYSISSGKYYLFTGNITVTVSTKNPGSMGHWSVCINADKAPQSGVGNSRPTSPCEGSGKSGKGNSGGR